MNIPETYLQMRRRVPIDSVALGYCAVHLFKPEMIKQGQTGYATAAVDEEEDAGWKEEWLVIGHEDLCGNPIFIDVSDSLFPVYTAEHGEERWQPEVIACSFRDFAYFLGLVKEISISRNNPRALEKNPLPEVERERILNEIAETGVSIDFWRSWLSRDSEGDD